MSTPNPYLHNAHLDGEPFYLKCPGPTAVLLFHGLTATPWEVRALGERLYKAGYTVDGPLLPGHGTRPEDLDRIRWHDWTDFAQQRYDQLAARYPNVIVGGESTGAVVALWLAIHNPEAAAVLAYAPAIRLAMTGGQIAQVYLAAPFAVKVPKRDLEKDKVWQGYKVYSTRGVLALIELAQATRSRLKQIHQPLLLIQGRNDRTIHPSSSELIAKGVSSPYVESHWLFDSGHCVLLDQEFEAAARLTLDFIRQGETP